MSQHVRYLKEETKEYVAMAGAARQRGESQEAARLWGEACFAQQLAQDAVKDKALFEETRQKANPCATR